MNEIAVGRSGAHSPVFQVFFNYWKGVAENRSFADCPSQGEKFDLGETGYDLSIDTVDNPGGESLVMLAVQKALYAKYNAETLMKSFVNLLQNLSRNAALRLIRPALHNPADVAKAVELGQG